MRTFKYIMIVFTLMALPTNVHAQFFKKLLNTVTEIISDKDDSTSPRSLAPKSSKKTSTETTSVTSTNSNAIAKLTDINVNYINFNASYPMLNVSLVTNYLGGGPECYVFVDSAPLPEATTYNEVMALKEKKSCGRIPLTRSFDVERPNINKADIGINAKWMSVEPYNKLYLRGYLLNLDTKKILDSKNIEINRFDIGEIPNGDSGELGKILNMKVIGIRSFSDCQKLYVDVTFWRQYTNTPFYCLLFATETPLNVNTVAALKPLTVKIPFGTGTKKGTRYSYGEKCIVSIPIPNSMQAKKLYLQGYAVTEKYTKTAGKTVGKPFIAHKTPSTIVNLADYEVISGMEGTDELAKLMTQSMFSELWGIDKNGNMICNYCNGLGCIECRWRGYNNKELLFFQKQKFGNQNKK